MIIIEAYKFDDIEKLYRQDKNAPELKKVLALKNDKRTTFNFGEKKLPSYINAYNREKYIGERYSDWLIHTDKYWNYWYRGFGDGLPDFQIISGEFAGRFVEEKGFHSTADALKHIEDIKVWLSNPIYSKHDSKAEAEFRKNHFGRYVRIHEKYNPKYILISVVEENKIFKFDLETWEEPEIIKADFGFELIKI